MPNFFFMGVQFFHLLALCIWIGGILIIGFVVAPVIFKKVPSKTMAGEIVGKILEIFDTIVYCLIGVLLVTGIIKYSTWENPTPWILLRYFFICLMSVGALYSATVNSPKMRKLKEEIPSFDTISSDDPNKVEFNRLHNISSRVMLLNFICGLLVLFFT